MVTKNYKITSIASFSINGLLLVRRYVPYDKDKGAGLGICKYMDVRYGT